MRAQSIAGEKEELHMALAAAGDHQEESCRSPREEKGGERERKKERERGGEL